VVLELAQYVTSNARVEAESIAASGAPDLESRRCRTNLVRIASRWQGGFVRDLYDKDLQQVLASFKRRRNRAHASLLPWMDEGERGAKRLRFMGRSRPICSSAAQRSDEPVINVGGQEYALGMSATASGKVVVVALPMPQGLSQTVPCAFVPALTNTGSSFAPATAFAPPSS
jgi:two-component system nitrogen regulation sensor histidine kinase NtrY